MGREQPHAAFHAAKGQILAKLRDDPVQPGIGAHV
jgi:hypothetical protein